MYLLYVTSTYTNEKYCLFLSNSHDDIKNKLEEYIKTFKQRKNQKRYKIEYNEEITEKYIEFSKLLTDKNFYLNKIDNLMNKKYIYILEWHESGEGGKYYDQLRIYYSYKLSDIMNIAENFYNEEEENPTNEGFIEMKKELKKNGSFELKNPISNLHYFYFYKIIM